MDVSRHQSQNYLRNQYSPHDLIVSYSFFAEVAAFGGRQQRERTVAKRCATDCGKAGGKKKRVQSSALDWSEVRPEMVEPFWNRYVVPNTS